MPLTGKDMLKLLKKNGWKEIRVTGSHHVMEKGSKQVIVPVHGNKDLRKGLEQRILKDAELKR